MCRGLVLGSRLCLHMLFKHVWGHLDSDSVIIETHVPVQEAQMLPGSTHILKEGRIRTLSAVGGRFTLNTAQWHLTWLPPDLCLRF